MVLFELRTVSCNLLMFLLLLLLLLVMLMLLMSLTCTSDSFVDVNGAVLELVLVLQIPIGMLLERFTHLAAIQQLLLMLMLMLIIL